MKSRFCKYCGSTLTEDKVCTGCGKKFFNLKPLKIICIVETIIIIFLLILGSKIMIDYNKYKCIYPATDMENIKKEYSSLLGKYDELETHYQETIKLLETSMNDTNYATNQLRRYQQDFAYHTINGSCYHKYTCSTLNFTETLLMGTIEGLEYVGYKRCNVCY